MPMGFVLISNKSGPALRTAAPVCPLKVQLRWPYCMERNERGKPVSLLKTNDVESGAASIKN